MDGRVARHQHRQAKKSFARTATICGFEQTPGVLGKSIKPLHPDTGHIKDKPLAMDGD
jgi:hypothetical protein